MSQPLARAISILGHPMLVLPLAALLLSIQRGDSASAGTMALGFAAFAGLVMAWSWWQVRRGRWQHVDASRQRERQTLNRFLLIALTLAAGVSAWTGPVPELPLGLTLSALLIAFALSTARWWKLSLHMAFVAYAGTLVTRAGWAYGIAALPFAVGVAWSRLALRRHTPRDLIAGALAGGTAGALFWLLAPRLNG